MTIGDRVKLELLFDVDRMRKEVLKLPLHGFIEYSVLPLTSPVAIPESSRSQSGPIDYADGSWATWHDTPFLQSSPYLSEIVEFFRASTTVTVVRLLRLAPGGFVKEHRDPTHGLEIENAVIRLTIPIISNDAVEFRLNGALVPWKPGECWYLRFTDPHTALNRGGHERLHLSIDMIPNEWVRSLIQGSMQ